MGQSMIRHFLWRKGGGALEVAFIEENILENM